MHVASDGHAALKQVKHPLQHCKPWTYEISRRWTYIAMQHPGLSETKQHTVQHLRLPETKYHDATFDPGNRNIATFGTLQYQDKLYNI